jgi:copper chaperone NosL
MKDRFRPIAALVLVLTACARGVPSPADLDTANDLCASCRMPVSDRTLAAQIVSRGEEPRFFDDIGCLSDFLEHHSRPAGSAIYVADHSTARWIPAETALFTRASALSTPMGSRLIAHADRASRDADPAARGGSSVSLEDILAAAVPGPGAADDTTPKEVPQ